MLAKMAFCNVRRSARDYAVYFVTLVLGVAMFYAFNSISSQQVLFDLQGAAEEYWGLVDSMMGMFSVLVALVLGFLTLYANRFLIKRRRNEFGTLMLLGMEPRSVSGIVLMETLAVGVASLVVGLIAGVLLAQGLSFLTSGILDIPMKEYQFVFSARAAIATVVATAVIFAVTALFNTIQVRRTKLSVLLGAQADGENFKMRPIWLSVCAFVVSLAMLAAAYRLLLINGLYALDATFYLCTGLMLAGTFLFFWSVSGFVLAVVRRMPSVYYRGLSMFTMRQLASKINAACVSMWAVCVVLFFGLTVFCSGMGLSSVFVGDISEKALFDATITGTFDEDGVASGSDAMPAESATVRTWLAFDGDSAACMSAMYPDWNEKVAATAQVDKWEGPAFGELAASCGTELDGEMDANGTSQIVSLSQLNALRELCGRGEVQLAPGTFAVLNTVEATSGLSRKLVEPDTSLDIAGSQLHGSGQVLEQPLRTSSVLVDMCVLVVPDEVVDAIASRDTVPAGTLTNVMFASGVDDASFESMLANGAAVGGTAGESSTGTVDENSAGSATTLDQDMLSSDWPYVHCDTSKSVLDDAKGISFLVTYIAIFVGFVLLMATAAILAIQQLSDVTDSTGRYRTLAELGCDRKMVFGSVRTKTLLYFAAPLLLAICHSACAMFVVSGIFAQAYGMPSYMEMLSACLIAMGVYALYFAVTYFCSRGMVKSSLGSCLLG